MAVCSGNQTLREEVTGPSIRMNQNKPKTKIIILMIAKEKSESGRRRGLITQFL